MVKNIYKAVILLAIFVGALFFFGRQMKTDISDAGDSVAFDEESFPVLRVETQGQVINALYGYSAPMDPDIVRESVTPLDESRRIALLPGKSATHLTRLQYQIVDKESGEVYDNREIPVIEPSAERVEITFDYSFKTSTEYILDILGTTDEGRAIHYYTRLKYYIDESNLQKKLAFVRQFHKYTFDKSKMTDIERYLEVSSTNRNTTLANVNITSSSDLVTWSGMSPKVISDELMTIKEYNMETACVQYNYFVEAETVSGKETYHIKEFYRVRHASGQNYLLNFERTMEADFDVKMASRQTSQLKLGITNDSKSRLLSNKEENILYFVRDNILYEYNMEKNEVKKIYSAFSDKASYLYRAYDEQGIRLLKVDDKGTLYFCVYGYFPRGEYEGDVAVILYEYAADGELQEMVYMPINATYQQLREDFDDYGYVSSRGIYYFTVANTVYSYNMTGKRLEKIAENVKSHTFMTMEGANCYVWSSSLSSGCGDNITIYNLETDEKKMLYRPDKNSYIRLLGVIEDNVVYGYVRKKDIAQTVDGSRLLPCYELHIASPAGEDLKTYTKSGCFIQSIEAKGNVINMTLCRKKGKNQYKEAGEDSILNTSESKLAKFSYSSRVTNKTLTEWYIRFPSTFVMPDVPKMTEGPAEFLTSGRFVRLEQPGIAKYYIYALGKITASFENARQAIREADRQMGVVVSSNHQVVWERSGSFLQNDIGGITQVRSGDGITNLAACACMVLKRNHLDVRPEELSKENLPVYDMLEKYMVRPVNLKGCTLEQVLYFVSSNKPVIAMTGDNKAVVISGYTTTQLHIYEPEHQGMETVSRARYEELFEQAGNRFISYMEE